MFQANIPLSKLRGLFLLGAGTTSSAPRIWVSSVYMHFKGGITHHHYPPVHPGTSATSCVCVVLQRHVCSVKAACHERFLRRYSSSKNPSLSHQRPLPCWQPNSPTLTLSLSGVPLPPLTPPKVNPIQPPPAHHTTVTRPRHPSLLLHLPSLYRRLHPMELKSAQATPECP